LFGCLFVAWQYGSGHLHTASGTCADSTGSGGGVFKHPPYSSKLTPSDGHLFQHLKFLAGQSVKNDQETKDVMQDGLKGF